MFGRLPSTKMRNRLTSNPKMRTATRRHGLFLGRSRRIGVLAGALLLLPLACTNALSLSTIDARAGILWLGSAGDGQVIAPSPILNDWGVSLPINFGRSFSIVPEVDLTGTQYQLDSSGTRAIPTEIEYRSAVWFLSVLVDPALRYTFHPTKTLAWGFTVAPAFVFRIPVVSWGSGAQQESTMLGYFYGKGRYFYPEAGAFFLWQLLPSIGLEVRLRSFFPVFHLWDGDGQPFYDQLMGGGSIGLRFRLGK